MSEDLEEKLRVHVWVYRSDWEKLSTMFAGRLKPSRAIRGILRNWIKHTEAAVESVEHRLMDLDLSEDGE